MTDRRRDEIEPRSVGAWRPRGRRSDAGRRLALCGLLALPCIPAAAQESGSDEPARTRVQSVARAFQRDLEARDWNALLTHFWPAKVGARWQPSGALEGATESAEGPGRGAVAVAARNSTQCAEGSPEVRLAGRWARVVLPSCASTSTELWMLEMNGRWKIVRLGPHVPPATEAPPAAP